ncbi:MAG: DUF3365 domain-containing protein [Leptospiraceae bacterium]|nr:DUF3365 domain-containing protein [Leptospiraceae bacterium]
MHFRIMKAASTSFFLLVFLLISCGESPHKSGQDLQKAGYEAISISREGASGFPGDSLKTFSNFKTDLAKKLTTALREKGAPGAIEVCSMASPEAEKAHSGNASVYRISDRPRNPDHAPDEFEMAVIQMWKSRKSEGKEIGPVHFQSEKHEYVMSPIPLHADFCLQCHGSAEEIQPATSQAIAELYPEDQATGYKKGELRGAFVARRALQ